MTDIFLTDSQTPQMPSWTQQPHLFLIGSHNMIRPGLGELYTDLGSDMAIDIFSVFLSFPLCMCTYIFTYGYVYVSICPVCSFSSHIYIYYLEFGYNMALISSVLITMCVFFFSDHHS